MEREEPSSSRLPPICGGRSRRHHGFSLGFDQQAPPAIARLESDLPARRSRLEKFPPGSTIGQTGGTCPASFKQLFHSYLRNHAAIDDKSIFRACCIARHDQVLSACASLAAGM